MVQLILDTKGENVYLPEAMKGAYTADFSSLSVDVEMVTGRMVKEVVGNVWVIKYSYGYFNDEMKRKVISACEKGRREPINCGFLPPTSERELSYSDFFVISFTYPKFMWSRSDVNSNSVPLWGDFSMTLREVKPND